MITRQAFTFIVALYTWCVENCVAVTLNSQYTYPNAFRLRGRMVDEQVDIIERGNHIENHSKRWPTAKKAGCPKYNWKFREHVALVVMWNVALDRDQATVLSKLYAAWFVEVVHVGGPDAFCNPENDEERGFGHAMYKCYAQAALRLSKNPKIEGVLFTADDIAFRPGDLPYLGLNRVRRIWLPPWYGRGTQTWEVARAEGWPWYDNPSVGLDALEQLFKEHSDLATEVYEALPFCSEKCLPNHYLTDVFYLPIQHIERFDFLASTFYNYSVFTEIATPIIVTLLGKYWEALEKDLPEAFDGEEIMEGDPLSYRNPNFVMAWRKDILPEGFPVRGSSPTDDTLQNLMVVSPEAISMLHPVKKSDTATMELWRRWLSQSGPCNVMPRVEKVLEQLPEPRPKLESWLPQILDEIKPANLTPLPFRNPDHLLPAFQRIPADVKISPEASTDETKSLLRRHRLMSRLPARCKGASLWAVLTTINPVEEGIKKLDDLPDSWCTVVVADLKTPRHNNGSYFPGAKRVFYLSPEEQKSLPFKTLEYIPWNSFARKNIGYLFAAAMGAEAIYDTDDDNILKSPPPLLHSESQTMLVRSMTGGQATGNVYSMFGGGAIWPRGTSLRAVSSTPSVHKVNVDTRKLAIQQSLVDGDPDVDAIYRLGARAPENGVLFESSSKPLVLERGVSAPTNSQSTTFLKSAFPLLLLPTTVHPRVADIWRGYFALPALWAANLTVAFTAPKVHQARNEHDLAEDLWAEWPLYHKVGSLVSYIQDMISTLPAQANPGQNTVAHVASQVYRDMYERGFVEAYDINLSSAFLQDIQTLPELEASYAL